MRYGVRRSLSSAKINSLGSIAANDTYGLRKLIRETKGRDTALLFESRNAIGEILFVQERIITEDGKVDLPWSYWGDDIGWLNMEPDGGLPLFGLDRLKDVFWVFLHEGAATAAAVQRLIDGGEWKWKQHPWGSDLRFGVHLGWPGVHTGWTGRRSSGSRPMSVLP